MVYMEKYNKEKTYYFQYGGIANYSKIKEIYPAVDDLTYVVTTDFKGQVILKFEILDVVRTELNIDTSLNDDEAIQAILDLLNPIEE